MEDYIEAHRFSINNADDLKKSEKCGCFYCLSIFSPTEIEDWIVDDKSTALCPHCGIDSVIAEPCGYPLTKEFLREMYEYWFC